MHIVDTSLYLSDVQTYIGRTRQRRHHQDKIYDFLLKEFIGIVNTHTVMLPLILSLLLRAEARAEQQKGVEKRYING